MADMQKTLMFYINSIHKGGAERVIVQLAGRFAAEGYRSILVTSFVDEGEYTVPAGVERISIEREQVIQSRIKRNLSRIAALRELIKKYKPAALISFMAEPNFRAIIAAKGLPVKNIVSVRNDPKIEYGGKFDKIVSEYIMPMADGCVFQTGDAKAYFSKKLQNKSEIIMNQVSEAFFSTAYNGERHDIVTAGRLNAQKNHALLIRAFAKIADKVEDNLCIYGIGNLKTELEELISSLGLEDRVRLMGLSDNVPESIKAAKLFVLSSDFEGMPNALLEAMALGLPCISTDCPCGGPAMIIRNGENGVLVPVGDENALSEEMLMLLSDTGKAERMGKAAKQTAESFRPDRVFAQWREYVDTIIN